MYFTVERNKYSTRFSGFSHRLSWCFHNYKLSFFCEISWSLFLLLCYILIEQKVCFVIAIQIKDVRESWWESSSGLVLGLFVPSCWHERAELKGSEVRGQHPWHMPTFLICIHTLTYILLCWVLFYFFLQFKSLNEGEDRNVAFIDPLSWFKS